MRGCSPYLTQGLCAALTRRATIPLSIASTRSVEAAAAAPPPPRSACVQPLASCHCSKIIKSGDKIITRLVAHCGSFDPGDAPRSSPAPPDATARPHHLSLMFDKPEVIRAIMREGRVDV